MLACYRYIELNPVRAGMVNQPADYPWSSFSINIGGCSDPFVVPHVEFAGLALDAEKRHRAYLALFEEEMDEALLQAIREAANTGYPLASDDFKDRVLAPLGWKTVAGKPGPKPSHGPGPEFVSRVVALAPN